jgi:hypothetical protein
MADIPKYTGKYAKLRNLLVKLKKIDANKTEEIMEELKLIMLEYQHEVNTREETIKKLEEIETNLETKLLEKTLGPKFKKSKKRSKSLRKTSRKSPTKPRRKSNQKKL